MSTIPRHPRQALRNPRFWLASVSGILALGIGGITMTGCRFSAPAYRGPISDHFDGTTFRNQDPYQRKSFRDVMKWRFTSDGAEWPDRRGNPPGAPPLSQVDGDRLRVTFVNHATVLLQVAGLNILTDPVWSERVSPVSWAGPKRAIDPGLRFDDLPRIDAVLVTHNHYDHLDIPTLRRLAQRSPAPAIYLPLGNTALLDKEKIAGGVDVDWWDEVRLSEEVTLTVIPAAHWSGRGTQDRMKTLWCGFVLETPAGIVYYAGDTGWGSHFQQVRDRFGPPRLLILPIGAYEPRWFMKDSHINPAEAVSAHRLLGAGISLGVHYGTWQLSDEGIDAPVEALAEALRHEGLSPEEFWTLPPGDARDVP